MAFDEKKHQRIADYLGNRLKEDSRKQFEQEMQADDQLSKEVELHRDMEELLSDSPENALRKNLKLLGEQAETTSTRKPSKWGVALIIPILLVAIWWFWGGTDSVQEDHVVPETEVEEPKPAVPNSELPLAPTEDSPVNSQGSDEETAPPPKPTSPPPPSPGRKRGQRESAPRAIAANFVPNPSIEFLIENNLRDTDLTVKLTKKQPSVRLTSNEDPTPFQIKVQLQSREDISQQEFKLHLFSNDRQAFDDFSPISTNDLSIVPVEADVYEIDFTKSYSLEPGLYYYIIEDFSEEKIHLVEKFEVQ